MKEFEIKVNYLYHSGFSVETSNHLMIFDYFNDSVSSGEKRIFNGAVGEEDLRLEKEIVVFSSHTHQDHFNPVILKWSEIRPDIRYILSSDIDVKKEKNNIHKLSAYEESKFDDITIKAFSSTDAGISFLVKVDGVSLFHSGDLNWWYWWDDTAEEIKKAESWFKNEIKEIEGEKIDIAFFPVDPRLEHNYYIGGEYFINRLKPSIFIPMHFGDNYEVTGQFAKLMVNSETKVIQIYKRGQLIGVNLPNKM